MLDYPLKSTKCYIIEYKTLSIRIQIRKNRVFLLDLVDYLCNSLWIQIYKLFELSIQYTCKLLLDYP